MTLISNSKAAELGIRYCTVVALRLGVRVTGSATWNVPKKFQFHSQTKLRKRERASWNLSCVSILHRQILIFHFKIESSKMEHWMASDWHMQFVPPFRTNIETRRSLYLLKLITVEILLILSVYLAIFQILVNIFTNMLPLYENSPAGF